MVWAPQVTPALRLEPSDGIPAGKEHAGSLS